MNICYIIVSYAIESFIYIYVVAGDFSFRKHGKRIILAVAIGIHPNDISLRDVTNICLVILLPVPNIWDLRDIGTVILFTYMADRPYLVTSDNILRFGNVYVSIRLYSQP